ncbi:hypothetical protein N665_0067s0028 [Sinapis alba]|nr:hypothetical protein N665_0067s0028 [Sinapis alba]
MSTSSCALENHYKRRWFADRGTPKQCWCGESAEIFTSGTAKNPGRLYFCCAKGYNKRHLFKWTYDWLVDEVEDTKSVISDMIKDMSELRANIAWLEKEIEGLKTESERRGGECMSEVQSLRNVVVCGFVIAIFCFYFFP